MNTELISPEKEPLARLIVFGAALVAIAARERTFLGEGLSVTAEQCRDEARGIADAVIEEAKRLQTQQERE